MKNNTKNKARKSITAIFFSVIMLASIAVLIPVSAASSEVIIDDHFDEPELDITKFEVITTGIGYVSISASVLGVRSGYGGSGSALVKSREAFSLTTTSKIIFKGIIDAYCEGWYPGVYGDRQPRGLRVGTDPNNAIEFISFAGHIVEARTVASGVATTTQYTLPAGKWVSEWVNYRIEATSSSVEFYVDGVLIATHTTNIPTGPLNLYMGTSYSGYGNVPVSADWLYLAVTPPTEVWVDDDYTSATPGWGYDHFDKIQDGIDAVAGSTVNVAAGTYTITAAINVNKGVTITGNVANPENVLVKYSPASSILNCVEVNSADVTIQGIKVQDCKNGFHFDKNVNTNTGVTISNCIIESVSGWGIGEISSPNTVISHNTITNAGDKGIYFRKCEGTSESNRCEAISNTISDCSKTWGCGSIQTYFSKYAYIYDNTISSTNDKGINIIRSGATGTADRIQVIGNTISETKWPGIQVIGSPYTYVYDNTLTKCNYLGDDWDYASIHVQDDIGPTYSHHTVIDSNTVSDGINGIQTWSDDCEITNNNIYDMGLTYANTKTTTDGTYYNSGIIIGSNWLTSNFKPTGTTVTCNNIHDNYWGLYVRDYATLSPGDPSVLGVTAECNWWGDTSGPTHSSNPSGIGDAVSDNVDFDSWAGKITGPIDPVEVGTPIYVTGHCTCDMVNAEFDWGDGDGDTLSIPSSDTSITGSHTYSEAGVYTVTLTVDDGNGWSITMKFQYVVVYDPDAGFVTGGGWIYSEAEAYTDDPELEGKANFGFVSKYKKGQQTLTGNTEFQFKAGDLNFHSDSYDWLVIAGHKAMYKGTGTINGDGNFGFMLSAIDEKLTSSTDVDMFRIRIWDKDSGDAVVYDNNIGKDDDADPTTKIAGGQIVIHKAK